MRIIAAYLLAVLGGVDQPDKAAIKKILDSVGIAGEDGQVDKVLAELKGKDINAVIAEGQKKIASLPVGGGGGGGGGAAPAAAAAPAGKDDAKGKEKPKEKEKEKEKSEESGGDMGFSLFD